MSAYTSAKPTYEYRRDRQVAARRRGLVALLLVICVCVSIVLGRPPVWALFLLPLLLATASFHERGAVVTAGAAALAMFARLALQGSMTLANVVEGLIAAGLFLGAGLVLGHLFSRQRRRESELSAGSLNDRLTGLYNYGTFADLLHREVSRAERYGTETTLIMLDLDRFKRFNDTYGHETGNVLLQRLGRTLQEVVRDADIAARYGGEEFAVLIRGDELDGMRLAERIRTTVLTMAVPVGDGEEVYVSLSAGVASFPHGATSEAELVEHADAALYMSKQAGRNMVTGHSVGVGGRRREDGRDRSRRAGDRDRRLRVVNG